MDWRSVVASGAALALTVSVAFAQRAPLVFPGPNPPSLTQEDIVAARGNVLRWRDSERARIGPFSRENDAINQKTRTSRVTMDERTRMRTPSPTYLPTGALLDRVDGYFAYFHEVDGAPRKTIVSGVFEDRKSNAGDASSMRVRALSVDAFCEFREVALADLAYLGRAHSPELEALNRDWVGPLTDQRTLAGTEVTFTKRPGAALISRHYPEQALRREQTGAVSLLCDIGESGLLSCAVAGESAVGWGFGAAALRVAAEGFAVDRMLPKDGGSAVGRKLCVFMNFFIGN